jgi:hypothetical protein
MSILTSASSYEMQPAQLVEGEYTDEMYMQTLRWLGSRYNNLSNNVVLTNFNNPTSNESVSYINEYIDNLSYIYGSQTPSYYNFFIKDVNGNNTANPLFRGLDVMKIFNYLNGEATDLIDPLPKILNASAYSVGAVSAKKEMLDFVNFQVKEKLFLQLLQQEAGFTFKAVSKDFQTQNEVDKFFVSAQEEMEIGYNRIAKHICYDNKYQIKLPKAFSNVLIGNLACVCSEYSKGQVRWRVIQPENAIVDYSKNYDVHDDDDFGGEVFQMPVTQVLSEWDWTEDERKELLAISRNQNGVYDKYYSEYATNNLYWFNNVDNGVPDITIIKGQWKSNEIIDGVVQEILREGVLIGGKWLKDQKISEGQVYEKGNVSKKRIKYITLTPNLFMGASVSIISIVKRIANLRDAFLTKVTEMASTPLGRVAIIRASKLPTGLRTPDVISQLKQAKVLVIEGEDTEEEDDGRKLAETLDLTIDPSIMSILQIAQYYESMISDVLNVPNQVRGQITDYASKKQLESSQTQSTKGLAYLFKNFLLFEKELISYSADLFKIKAPNDELGRESLSLIVGDNMVELMSMDVVQRMSFEDFLINLNPNDYNSVDKKARLTELIGQVATSGAPLKVIETYVAAEQAETLTELRNFIETTIYKEQAREDAQLAQQQQMQMQQAENANNAQRDIASIQANAGMEKQAMSDEAKIEQAMLSQQNRQQP